MFSNKRIEELELKVAILERNIGRLEDDIRNLSHIPVFVGYHISGNPFSHYAPVKDIVAQLLDLHGLKIVREQPTREQFTLVAKKETAADEEAGAGANWPAAWEGRGEKYP